MYKIVATDMDGTFLDANHAYDRDRLAKVLETFNKHNVLFVAASGRALLALTRLFDGFAQDMAMVAENGAALVQDGQLVFEEHLTKAQYLDIIEVLSRSPYLTGDSYLLSGKNGAYALRKASQSYLDHISLYYDNLQLVDDFNNIDDVIFKVTANFGSDIVRQGEAWVNEQLDYVTAVTTGFQSIDIILKDVNKRTGLEALCQKLGVTQDQVIAFGDNLNDLEMLTFAGRAVATANARQEIKDVADEVIGSCEEQSVMAYMEELANELEH